jgi:hypothetical protein
MLICEFMDVFMCEFVDMFMSEFVSVWMLNILPVSVCVMERCVIRMLCVHAMYICLTCVWQRLGCV